MPFKRVFVLECIDELVSHRNLLVFKGCAFIVIDNRNRKVFRIAVRVPNRPKEKAPVHDRNE